MFQIIKFNFYVSIITFTFILGYCYASYSYNICDKSLLKGSLNSVNISNCDPDLTDKCIFKKGQNVTITVSFTSHETVDYLKVKIYGIIMGLPIPWPVFPDDACMRGIQCPIANNSVNTFNLSMPVSTTYPSIPVNVRLRLEDRLRNPYLCVQFPAKLES
ncbi:NPC intracellular cholesterol transporter 2-like [Oppia nitens]|uniref:NPC intracellular cholesterol transporter 2-like n=1 Tax=Oppia nitens TaxID=1686743 RepID=UPI0023DC360B|nr:NPC intracellular cholesterol transporter 2-like [Oppia nitens]